jgi:hypothetical protein
MDYEHMPGKRKKDKATGWRESVWFCLEDVIGFVNRLATPMMALNPEPETLNSKPLTP